MKITLSNNAELIIQANVKKEGDYKKAMQIAERMEELGYVDCVVASCCEYEQWIHMTAVWDNFQAQELKDVFYAAKEDVTSYICENKRLQTHLDRV